MASEDMTKARVSTASHIGIIAKYNFLNYFRARRFYVMLVIVALVSALFTSLVAYYRPPGLTDSDPITFYAGGWGRFISLLVVLSTAFFGGDAISSEFQNRTGYFLVPNPIRRSAIYVGKWLAAVAASAIIIGLFALVMLLNGLYYYPGSVPSEFVQSFAFSLTYLVAALSLAFLFSSLFKSSAISILMNVILLLIVFGIVDAIVPSFAGVEPWFSITYGAGIVSSVLSIPYPEHVQIIPAGRDFNLTIYNATIPEGLAILAVYFVVCAAVGLWLFEKKEFTS